MIECRAVGDFRVRLQRGYLAAVVAVMGGAPVLAGCGSTQGAAKPSAVVRPTLDECAAAWNNASLGDGKQAIRAVARADASATFTRSRDGVCVLAFASRVSGENKGFYISVLGGDYWLDSPVNGYGSKEPPPPNLATLRQSAANGRPNVVVDARTGTVVPRPGARLPLLPYTLLDGPSACKIMTTPPTHLPLPTIYKVVKSDVSCSQARTLIFAYVKGEGVVVARSKRGSAPGVPVRMIVGWRCHATGWYPLAYLGSSSSRLRLNCAAPHGQAVVAEESRPTIVGR